MKKHYETHVEDTDKLISVAGPVLDYKSWYEQYRKLMEEQAQRKYGLYTPTSEGDDDDFPSIPGMIARYSASGLTNEQMKENPVWVDKTGNGHDLQMKNFAWKEGSGISDVYPGFILGDGVDDYAVSEKDLDFEDTYTVYTAFIPSDDDLKDGSKAYGVCGKDYTKDFYLRYSHPNLSRFYSARYTLDLTLSNGFNLIACKRTADKMQFKNLLTGASIEADAKTLVKNPGLYYLWRSATIAAYARAAIAGQVICNGHFTTDEEDTKVLNWYKKEYPWLFFDQAWTVTGKTNKDTDRATIANITGNGNDLVLSNFGFAEGSGYNEQGEYAGYLVTDGVDDMITSSAFQMGKDFTIVGDWKFIDNKKSGTGLVKGSSFYIYNTMIGLDLYINSGSVKNSLDGIKSINAACSDGRAYDRNWNEILANTGNVVGSGGMLEVSSSGGRFDLMAFKNLAIYPRILSKNDCIKAYNYLQTLKAK